MYRDQLGEFVCRYWGLKGQGAKKLIFGQAEASIY